MMKNSFKSIFSFEFWQKFGKALMVVVAVMPAAGLMISIGKSLPMINPNFGVLLVTFTSYSLLRLGEAGLKNALAVPLLQVYLLS